MTSEEDNVPPVSGLRVIAMPSAYVPTAMGSFSEASSAMSTHEIRSVTEDIHRTGHSNIDSILNQLRRTNMVPSDIQARQLHSFSAACDAEIANLDRHIRKLHEDIAMYSRKLTHVSCMRVQKQNQAVVCRSFFSPIRRLPPELLGEIFVRCLPKEGTPSPRTAPLLLCHVCSVWRVIALGLPKLWDTLSMKFSWGELYYDARLKENVVNVTRFWFENAGTSCLSFMLHRGDDGGPHVLEDIILSYSSRFRNLHLLLRADAGLPGFFCLPDGHVEQLECLSLRLIQPGLDTQHKEMSIFRTAPRLQRVVLDLPESWIGPGLSRIPLPWTQLTHLEIATSLPSETWKMLFRSCILLEYCATCVDFSDMETSANQQMIKLPKLIDLSVSAEISPTQEFTWFRDFEFPSLRVFEMHYHAEISPAVIHEFREILSLRSLRRLILMENIISTNDLISLLRATPSLVELNLWLNEPSKNHSTNMLWDMLEYHTCVCPPYECLLARLEVLDLWIWDCDYITALACLQVIKSRWWTQEPPERQPGSTPCPQTPVQRLRRASLHFCEEKHLADRTRQMLEPCRLEGLDVLVDTKTYLDDRSGQW